MAQWNGLQNRKAGGSNPPVSSKNRKPKPRAWVFYFLESRLNLNLIRGGSLGPKNPPVEDFYSALEMKKDE